MTATTAMFDAPLLQRPLAVRWFAERPRIADLLVIAACTVPTVAALLLATPPHAWLGYLCAAGVAIAFWWRRSHPLAVLLTVVPLAALNPISANSTSVAFLESCFALYALAAYRRLPTAILGYLLSEALGFAVAGLTILLGFREGWPIALLQPAALVALALGVAARAARSRRDALHQVVALREERAAAAERARITAELHDVVAHSVTVMIALAGGAAAGWEKHPERARLALDQLGTVGGQALEEMQRILRILRSADTQLDRSLEASGHNVPPIDELVEVFRTAGLPVRLAQAESDAHIADPALRTTVYRIVQEALTNSLRYARDASHVQVEIDAPSGGDRICVTVTDNGRGGATRASLGAGVGLRAMRERAEAFGGHLEAGPLPSAAGTPGTGWRIHASIPLSGGVS